MNNDSGTVAVGSIDDLVDGQMSIVVAGGKEVGLLRWNDKVFAVLNVCPHRGAPVCAGIVSPATVSQHTGSLELNRERPILACSWHRWEFDVRTGQALYDKAHLRTYPVSVDADGQVVVDLRGRSVT